MNEERLVALEIKMKILNESLNEEKQFHRNEIQAIKKSLSDLHLEFEEIINLVRSIKWWLVGMVSFIVIEQVGLAEFFKKILL